MDATDFRLSRGPDQPDSMQGSTRIGSCTVCDDSPVPVELYTAETPSGSGYGRWVCCPCYRKMTSAAARRLP